MRVAIVIPTLDEEPAIAARLPGLLAAADEVVVSDGGSRDGTVATARHLGAVVVTGPPGRGGQLARGAAATTADALLFLHADTVLAPDALAAVRAALATGAVGGGFRVRFDAGGILRLGARLVDLRTELTRLPLGDQAQFASRAAYERLGGFRDWPILEDLDFALRLRRAGRVVVLGPPVVTSARRYLRRGVLRTVATNWLIWLLFFAGMSPQRLARLYRHVR